MLTAGGNMDKKRKKIIAFIVVVSMFLSNFFIFNVNGTFADTEPNLLEVSITLDRNDKTGEKAVKIEKYEGQVSDEYKAPYIAKYFVKVDVIADELFIKPLNTKEKLSITDVNNKKILNTYNTNYRSILANNDVFNERYVFKQEIFPQVDNTKENHGIIVIKSFKTKKVLAIILVEFDKLIKKEKPDHTKLFELLDKIESIDKTEDYYKENDKFRGGKYLFSDTPPKLDLSKDSKRPEGYERYKYLKDRYKWADSNRKLILKNQYISQETIDKHVGYLEEALADLMPKNEVNITECYEKYCRYKQQAWRKGKLTFSSLPSDEYIDDDNTIASEAYSKYKCIMKDAEDFLNSLYLDENKPTAYNDVKNKVKIEEQEKKILEELKTLPEIIERIECKMDSESLNLAIMAYKGIKLYAEEYFANQNDEEYLKARDKALKFLDTNVPPNIGTSERKAKEYYNMYMEIREAYQGIGSRGTKNINISLSYINSLTWTNNKFGFNSEMEPVNILELQNVELEPGKATVKEALKKIGWNRTGGLYINGVYQYLGNSSAVMKNMHNFDTKLNDGDEVVIAEFHGPQVKYFDEHGYQNVLPIKQLEHIRYQNLHLGSDEIVVAKSFKLKAEATKASIMHYKKNDKPVPLENGGVYISKAYPTEEEARKGKIDRYTKLKTDSKGEVELKLYEDGWYALNVFSLDKWEDWLCNGPSLIFQVKKSDDIEGVRLGLKSELDEVYQKYGKEHFSADDWNKLQKIYQNASEALKKATTGKEMADAVYPAVEEIEALQKKASSANEGNLAGFYANLNRFPDNLGNMDAAAEPVIKLLENNYKGMTDYQRGQLDPVSKTKYETIIEKQKKGLPAAREYSLKISTNFDGVEKNDRAGLVKILEALKASNPIDDELTPKTGKIPLAKLFTFNTKKDYKNGIAFESFDKHTAMENIYALVNPDYVSYLLVRDKDPEAKFNILDIADGKISDEDTSMDIGVGKDSVNVRLLGKMSYIVNGHAYEIKDIKVKGLEKYNFEKIPFYEHSLYKGKTKSQCNMYVPNSFVSFEMPFEDVEIEVIFGSKYGNADQIKSAKSSAKASIESAFAGYKREEYDDAAWQSLVKAKDDAIEAINSANDIKEVNKARSEGLAAMAKVRKKAGFIVEPKQGEPEAGSSMGKVYVSVENMTFPGGAFKGRFVEGWYDLGEKDTMMTLILRALKRAGYSWNGTGGKNADDYTIGYLAYVYKDENKDGKWNKGKEPKLGEFDGEGGSGWMGTLNDWFTNFGFQSFSYENGWLTNNDVISVQFTQNLGVDLGGTWGNSDTRLKDLQFSKGKLTPSFSPDVLTYDLILPSEKESLVITPTAMNKNYLVKSFLNLYNDDSSYYKRPETMGVKAGDIIYIGCGDRSWPSMNKQGAEARYYSGTKYTIRVQTAGVSSIASRIAELPEVRRITVNSYAKYEDRVNALYKQYEELSASEKAKIKPEDAKKLKEVYERVKFFAEIGKMKEILKKLPDSKKASDEQIKNAKSDIEKAASIYSSLSNEQKKHITIADVANYNALIEKLKTLKVDVQAQTIAGSAEAPVSTILEPKAEVKGGKAVAKLDEKAVKEVLKQVAKTSDKKLIIIPEGTKDAKSVQVNIPKESAKAIAEQTGTSLSIETNSGQVDITPKAVESMVKESGGSDIVIDISLKEKAEVKDQKASEQMKDKAAVAMQVTVTANGKHITKFAGNLDILIPVNNKFVEGKNYTVTQISEDGTKDYPVGKCVKIGGKLYVKVSVNHLSTFVVSPEAVSDIAFIDIKGHWAYDAIKYVYTNKLMSGISSDKFAPDMSMSRAMLVTVLHRLDGSKKPEKASTFKDVQAGQWYTDAVAWASENGIVNGYSESAFGTNDDVTREQIATIMKKYADYKKFDTKKRNDLAQFSDKDAVSSWATEAMSWAVGDGLLTGRTTESLAPKGTASRAEVATILKRYMENVVKTKVKADGKAAEKDTAKEKVKEKEKVKVAS